MCGFLKGRGKGACETPNVSTVDSLPASIWIWISTASNRKTKTSALRFRSLVRSETGPVSWTLYCILVPRMTQGELEALPFWLYTHAQFTTRRGGDLILNVHSQRAILHVLSSNDKLMTHSEGMRIQPCMRVKMLFMLHSLESIQQVHRARTGYHCRYTDLRSHWAFCRRTFRTIIIRCWND